MEHYGNRRQRVEPVASGWNQDICEDADLAGEPDDPLLGASAEPVDDLEHASRTRKVDAMRTARADGVSVTVLAQQFDVHRGTVRVRTRESR